MANYLRTIKMPQTKVDHIEKIKITLADELAAVEQELRYAQSDIPVLNEVAAQLLQSGGKRLRPIMAIASALSCGYKGNTHIALAAIIEMIHAATLLHDDVIDNSVKRRCQDTVNKVWGNKQSILAGDYVYSIAFQKMVAIKDPIVLKILSAATSYIVEGEIIQLTQAHDPNTNIASYLDVITRKTAKLFQVAAELGAVISNADSKQVTKLSNIGNSFGMAYQIVNDLDDYSSDHQSTGKNICDDLLEGKPTLPYIMAYNSASGAQREVLARSIAKDNETKLNIENVLSIMEATDAFNKTKTYANTYLLATLSDLKSLEQNEYTSCMCELIYYLQDKISL